MRAYTRASALLCTAICFGLLFGSGVAQAAGPDPQGTIYVADNGTSSVDIFPPGSNGNVAPERVISGADTGLVGPGDVKVDSAGDVYVANFSGDSITEYAPGASGDAVPICTISGSNTGLNFPDDMSLEADGTLVVGNLGSPPTVLVFAPKSCGNVAPTETITGSNTTLVGLDGVGTDATGRIYAANTEGGAIDEFPAGSNGNVAPDRVISGPGTGLGWPDDVVVGFGGQLFVTSGFGGPVNSVTVYTPGASGNALPTEDITGSNTDFQLPDDLAVDTSGDIFVTDSEATVGPAVLEFASGATGNVAPTATITGSNTGLTVPEGVAIAGPPQAASPTMTTTPSASSISLGGSTSDTATLSDGTSPTGSIVFRLFGPNDSSCSGAPAYVSPPVTVTGDGSYSSPSFMPTATGTYSWQAEYSGDTQNAPFTTACNDSSEQVTVNAATTKPPSVDDASYASGYGSVKVGGLVTTQPNELVVAYLGADGPAQNGGQSIASVTGSEGTTPITFTRAIQENGGLGDVEVWYAKVATPGKLTVAATAQKKYEVYLEDVSYKDATGIGQVGAGDGFSPAPNVTLAGTSANSWVWGVGFDWSAATPRTPGSAQTVFEQALLTGSRNTFWVQSTIKPTPGGNVTINDTTATSDEWDLAVVEIK
jgi:hypothetical protein